MIAWIRGLPSVIRFWYIMQRMWWLGHRIMVMCECGKYRYRETDYVKLGSFTCDMCGEKCQSMTIYLRRSILTFQWLGSLVRCIKESWENRNLCLDDDEEED